MTLFRLSGPSRSPGRRRKLGPEKLAKVGAKAAIKDDDGIAEGVNTYDGVLTYEAVAAAQKRDWKAVAELV